MQRTCTINLEFNNDVKLVLSRLFGFGVKIFKEQLLMALHSRQRFPLHLNFIGDTYKNMNVKRRTGKLINTSFPH